MKGNKTVLNNYSRGWINSLETFQAFAQTASKRQEIAAWSVIHLLGVICFKKKKKEEKK